MWSEEAAMDNRKLVASNAELVRQFDEASDRADGLYDELNRKGWEIAAYKTRMDAIKVIIDDLLDEGLEFDADDHADIAALLEIPEAPEFVDFSGINTESMPWVSPEDSEAVVEQLIHGKTKKH